jgi:TRAP-type C4-dicarboxylate transport system substrate-binding protein
MLMVLFFLSVSTLEAKTTTLRFASYHPPRGIEYIAPKWLMDEITKRTNGDLKFEEYFAGSLLKGRELLKGIQGGTANMGYVMPIYYPRELQLFTLPTPFINGPTNPRNKTAFGYELFSKVPGLEKQLASWNQKMVAIHVFGSLSVGGTVPIKAMADIKGLKLRAAGGYDAQHMKCLGASVVFMPMGELYSALQKKAVQGAYTATTGFLRSKLYETGNPFYLLKIQKFTGVMGLITINLDTWNSLSSEDQKVIAEVGREYGEFQSGKIIELEQDYINQMAAKGTIVSIAPKEEVAQWANNCEADAKARWVKEAQEKGFPGKELMQLVSELIQKHAD